MQPEKMVVFGPIIIFFGFFLALIVGFLAVVVKLFIKGKKSAWRGTVIDKMHKTGEDMDSNTVNHYYTLVFKTEEGRELKAGVSKATFDNYKIGDKAEKIAGKIQFEKID